MLRSWLAVLVGAAVLCSSAFTSIAAQSKGTFESDVWGFKLRAPPDWAQIPLGIDEQWTAAKFLSDKANFYTDPAQGWTFEHKPTLTVIAFLSEKLRKEKEKVETTGAQGGRIIFVFQNPYKDYLDYLKKAYSGGGHYVDQDGETKVEGLEVRTYEIKVEKGSYQGPKRLCTWVFKTEEVDFAVQFEVLEDAYPKWKSTIQTTLKSFRVVKQVDDSVKEASTPSWIDIYSSEFDKLAPNERRLQMQQREKALHDKALKTAPQGWTASRIGRCVVINHCDDKLAKRRVEQVEGIYKWLDQAFPYIGPDEYVRGPILRICKDWEEERAFREGANWWSGALEVTTHDDQSGKIGYETRYMNTRVFEIWMHDRDRELTFAMPPWVRWGLEELVGLSQVGKGRLEFRNDDWDRDELRERLRNDDIQPVEELIQLGLSSFMETNVWGNGDQACALMRYLIAGDGAKSPKTKEVLKDYIRNLKAVITEMRAEDAQTKGTGESQAKSEEEEEAEYMRRQNLWKERERKILDQVFDRTFRSWSEKDWKQLNEAFKKSLK